MILKIVIDASVVLKWIPGKNEEKVFQARMLNERMLGERIEVIAPSFLLFEVLNVLVRKRKTPHRVVQSIIDRLQQSNIRFYDAQMKVVSETEKIVFKYKVTAYDALYLALAKKKNCKLVTYDSELLKIKSLTISVEDYLREIVG